MRVSLAQLLLEEFIDFGGDFFDFIGMRDVMSGLFLQVEDFVLEAAILIHEMLNVFLVPLLSDLKRMMSAHHSLLLDLVSALLDDFVLEPFVGACHTAHVSSWLDETHLLSNVLLDHMTYLLALLE